MNRTTFQVGFIFECAKPTIHITSVNDACYSIECIMRAPTVNERRSHLENRYPKTRLCCTLGLSSIGFFLIDSIVSAEQQEDLMSESIMISDIWPLN